MIETDFVFIKHYVKHYIKHYKFKNVIINSQHLSMWKKEFYLLKSYL